MPAAAPHQRLAAEEEVLDDIEVVAESKILVDRVDPEPCGVHGRADLDLAAFEEIWLSSAGCVPAITFTSVDFPAPLSPTSATTSDAYTSKSTPPSASTASKCFVTPRSSSSGSLRRSVPRRTSERGIPQRHVRSGRRAEIGDDLATRVPGGPQRRADERRIRPESAGLDRRHHRDHLRDAGGDGRKQYGGRGQPAVSEHDLLRVENEDGVGNAHGEVVGDLGHRLLRGRIAALRARQHDLTRRVEFPTAMGEVAADQRVRAGLALERLGVGDALAEVADLARGAQGSGQERVVEDDARADAGVQ